MTRTPPRVEHGVVEGGALRDVGTLDGDVIEHAQSLPPGGPAVLTCGRMVLAIDRLGDDRHLRHGHRDAGPGGRHLRRRALGQPLGPGRRGVVPGQPAARPGHLPPRGPSAEDPLGRRPLGPPRGAQASVELVDGSIYLAISLRNVGSGLAVIFGWCVHRAGHADITHTEPEQFRMQTRDLYIAPGDIGFWQAAIREADDPDYAGSEPGHPRCAALHDRPALRRPRGRAAHHHPLRHDPASQAEGETKWFPSVARHWNLDRPDPR